MILSPSYTNYINALCALLLLSQPVEGKRFVPRDVAAAEAIAHRLCEPAAPDVSESSVRLLQSPVAQPPLISCRSLPMFAIRPLPTIFPHVPTKCRHFGSSSQLRFCANRWSFRTVQMQQSAANTCSLYLSLFDDCLVANQDDHTACSDSLFGAQDCKVYTSVIPRTKSHLHMLIPPTTDYKLTPTVAATIPSPPRSPTAQTTNFSLRRLKARP